MTTMTNRFIQAYRQAPWRGQLQWIGLALLVIVVFSLTAWVYLSVSSRTSIAGRDIQEMRSTMNKTEENIADIQSQIASLTTTSVMENRAKKLGYKVVDPDKSNYMVISGYNGRKSPDMTSTKSVDDVPGAVITSEFTQSLWDWMYQRFVDPTLNLGQ